MTQTISRRGALSRSSRAARSPVTLDGLTRALATPLVYSVALTWWPVWLLGYAVLFVVWTPVVVLAWPFPFGRSTSALGRALVEAWGRRSASPVDGVARLLTGRHDWW
jgi:hypothetical protein